MQTSDVIFNTAVENYPFAVAALIILTARLFFLLLNKQPQNPGESGLIKPKLQHSTLQSILIKTILFMGIFWLLNHFFNAFSLLETAEPSAVTVRKAEMAADGRGVDGSSAVSAWLGVITANLSNFSSATLLGNLFASFVFASMYLYFNIQLSFAALILALFSYFDVWDASWIAMLAALVAAIGVGWLYFALKKRLLDAVRTYFAFLQASTGGSRAIHIELSEFYLVCFPYMLYSVLFGMMLLNMAVNLTIQLTASHAIAYFVVYRLYRNGQDVGFDYDPF
ncbi:MAG: hypothetical protein ACU837_06340 [Gammaproteobacteria bacterium]